MLLFVMDLHISTCTCNYTVITNISVVLSKAKTASEPIATMNRKRTVLKKMYRDQTAGVLPYKLVLGKYRRRMFQLLALNIRTSLCLENHGEFSKNIQKKMYSFHAYQLVYSSNGLWAIGA